MKVLLRTFGCRANQYDTEAVRQALAFAGIEEVSRAEDANVAVFNSCSVTAAAESDLRSEVRRIARLNGSIRTIVMGCAAGMPARDEVKAPLRTLPTVTDTIPGADLAALASALGIAAAHVPSRTALQTGARALLRIQDGCDEHCTFCATTLARGANRSRPVEDLVVEASALAASHPEIVITGIHIGTWGADIDSSLGALIGALIERIPRVRFRLSSLEATEVDDSLRELLAYQPERLAPHLHAPLQSGSDAVLRRMGRHWYSARSYSDAIERIVGDREVFGLSADVIAGFPGESDDDHSATMALVERLPFTSLHVFQFSPRPGTAALRLGGQVPSPIAGRRAAELRELARRKSEKYASSRHGGMADVVTIRRGEGLTGDYLSVSIADDSIPRRARFRASLDLVKGQLIATATTNGQG